MNGRNRPLTFDELVKIIWFLKASDISTGEIARKLKRPQSTISSVRAILADRYWSANRPGSNQLYTEAVKTVKELIATGEDPFMTQVAPEAPQSPPLGGVHLTVLEIVKIIYLAKATGASPRQIAQRLHKNMPTVWACLRSIEKRYWKTDPKSVRNSDPRYADAVAVAKEILVKQSDPFTDPLAGELIEHLAKRHRELLQAEEPQVPPENITPAEDLYKNFEKEIIAAVVTFTTELVKVKTQDILQTYVTEIRMLKEQQTDLQEKNNALTAENEKLTGQLSSQQESSLSASLKNSLENPQV